eukprot:TRINITY_DN384245_c0_g3_i1.p1 TRINITY_DN384245_c0_g3~~TRINITY_DN384245_c0_g3_i1.p1  ORF type:complete len:448 (+),score=126.49 TRINITY_DN384245_c0_g3_i1:155-1345(+)
MQLQTSRLKRGLQSLYSNMRIRHEDYEMIHKADAFRWFSQVSRGFHSLTQFQNRRVFNRNQVELADSFHCRNSLRIFLREWKAHTDFSIRQQNLQKRAQNTRKCVMFLKWRNIALNNLKMRKAKNTADQIIKEKNKKIMRNSFNKLQKLHDVASKAKLVQQLRRDNLKRDFMNKWIDALEVRSKGDDLKKRQNAQMKKIVFKEWQKAKLRSLTKRVKKRLFFLRIKQSFARFYHRVSDLKDLHSVEELAFQSIRQIRMREVLIKWNSLTTMSLSCGGTGSSVSPNKRKSYGIASPTPRKRVTITPKKVHRIIPIGSEKSLFGDNSSIQRSSGAMLNLPSMDSKPLNNKSSRIILTTKKPRFVKFYDDDDDDDFDDNNNACLGSSKLSTSMLTIDKH